MRPGIFLRGIFSGIFLLGFALLFVCQVSLNPHFTARELGDILADCGANTLVSSPDFAEVVRRLRTGGESECNTPLKTQILSRMTLLSNWASPDNITKSNKLLIITNMFYRN